MASYLDRATRLLLVLALSICLIPSPAAAQNRDLNQNKFVRAYTDEASAPIGTLTFVAQSGSKVFINGRVAHNGSVIWNGDLVETYGAAVARVSLDSIAQIMIRDGAGVRIATRLTRPDDGNYTRLLVASLTRGEIMVSMDREAVAYVETGEAKFMSSKGESFHIRDVDGHTKAGETDESVFLETSPAQRNCMIRSVSLDANGRVSGPGPNRIKVRRGGSQQQVHGQLTCGGRPVPGHPMIFRLSKNIGSVGSQSFTTITNTEGVATVTFTSGPTNDSAELTATAEGLDAAPFIWKVTVGGFWTKTKIILTASGIAALIIGVIVIKDSTNDGGPIMQPGPPKGKL